MLDIIQKYNGRPEIKKLLDQTLHILKIVGIPLEGKTENALIRMAECFLAVAGIKESFDELKTPQKTANLKTRDIIQFINNNFDENISSGSYDDIRRKHLKLLILSGLVVNSGTEKGAATNDPTRGYTLSPEFATLLSHFETDQWDIELELFFESRERLSDILSRKREMETLSVALPDGSPLTLSPGEHNVLQKAIIEAFLPRFGSGCQVLYIGDTSNKALHISKDELRSLNFFELSHDQLPDIVAYSYSRNRLFLIEAVHSTGPMSEIRVHELKQLLGECPAELIFVTAFLTKKDFKKWMLEIAWETEVWIAEIPDHLIHFNGHKFLGAS